MEQVGRTKPIYAHSCDTCTFLGRLHCEDDRKYDLYRCSPELSVDVTYLARYGDAPEDYWSMPWGVLRKAEGGTHLLRAVQAFAR